MCHASGQPMLGIFHCASHVGQIHVQLLNAVD